MAAHVLDLAPLWVRLLAGFAAGTLTWIVAADYGTLAVSRVVAIGHPAGRIGVGAACGYALIGSVVGLASLIGGINGFTMWGVLACALAIRIPRYLRHAAEVREAWARARSWLGSASLGDRVAIAVIALAVLTGLVNAALPAVWWDPIAYHLPIAAAAMRHGAFFFDPRMVQSGFPLLGEAAALPAYAIAGSAGAAMATLGAGLCVGLLVWALADAMSAGCGIVGAMLAMSSAAWAWLAPSFYVDVPFAMFVVAALVVALHLRDVERDRATTSSDGPALGALAGALCGAAAAVKYSGLGAALVVAVFILWAARSTRARTLLNFVGGFVFLAGGWYARSWLLTRDPLYPFLSPLLSHSPSVRDFAIHYVDMTRHWCGGGTQVSDLILLPYRLIADPRFYCGDPGLALRVGIVFAVAAVIFVRSARVLALAAAALTLLWFATSQQWRFLLPALFIYSAIVAAGACAASRRLRTVSAVTLAILCAVVVLANWTPLGRSQASASVVPALGYISGRVDASEYLDSRLETFAAARWLAEFAIEGDQIVALDDVRDYYMPAGTMWANPYYQQFVSLDWSVPANVRYGTLTATGKRYLVVNENAAYLHRTPTGVDWTVFAADRGRGLREVFSRNGVSVYDMSTVR